MAMPFPRHTQRAIHHRLGAQPVPPRDAVLNHSRSGIRECDFHVAVEILRRHASSVLALAQRVRLSLGRRSQPTAAALHHMRATPGAPKPTLARLYVNARAQPPDTGQPKTATGNPSDPFGCSVKKISLALKSETSHEAADNSVDKNRYIFADTHCLMKAC